MLLRKEASSVQAIFEVEIRFNEMIVTTSLLNKIIFQLEKAFFLEGGFCYRSNPHDLIGIRSVLLKELIAVL